MSAKGGHVGACRQLERPKAGSLYASKLAGGTMAHRSFCIGVLLASASLLTATGVNAQGQRSEAATKPLVFGSDEAYEVRFDDDPLAALPNGVIVPRITVRQGVGSPRLMRARTQFVVEMLKSAETF
jgi:hypothetical protein